MKTYIWSLAGTLGLGVLLAAQGLAQSDEPPPDPTPQGVEVQARGPVHEAYAEPTETRPLPSLVVTKQPPDPIDELPPDEKPAGDNVVWIPGYWGWDEEGQDFLWVSGCWRVPPPNRQWVPGHWQQVEEGWQWTAGFWAPTAQTEITYLSAPPPSLDRGPSTPALDENSIYSPGCWVQREQRCFWRPGFWVGYRPNWTWVPAHYVWTPAGYVFVEGYWDHPLEQRGLLFAPVRIDRSALTADWSYTPRYVVQSDFMLGALFVRPKDCHYYFGDYFEKRDAQRGFVSWVDYRPARESVDPNFAYYRHRFGQDDSWERNLRELYAARTRGDVARPPRTLVQQNTVVKNLTVNKTENVTVQKNINITNSQNVSVLAPVTHINNTRVTNLASLSSARTNAPKVEEHVIKVEAVSKEQKAEVYKAVTQFRVAAQQRHQVEAKALRDGGAPVKPTDPPKAVKIQLPPAPAPHPIAQPDRPKPPPVKEPPTPPTPPRHEERPIPPHEPPKPPAPPRVPVTPKDVTPTPKPPAPTLPPPAPAPKPPPLAPPPPAPAPKPPAHPPKPPVSGLI
jgi:WXXGXW repeat (2 copies)